jgi:hypothetical protein
MPESLNAFVDLVVPELQSRGVYKTASRQGTLREKLFPGRAALLHSTHPGASFCREATLTTNAAEWALVRANWLILRSQHTCP